MLPAGAVSLVLGCRKTRKGISFAAPDRGQSEMREGRGGGGKKSWTSLGKGESRLYIRFSCESRHVRKEGEERGKGGGWFPCFSDLRGINQSNLGPLMMG